MALIKRTIVVCFSYLHIICAFNCNIIFDNCAYILPEDPNAVIGKPISLTCTLKNVTMTKYGVDSSDIVFTIGDKRTAETFTSNQTLIVNSSTAELYIENVTFIPSFYFVSCFIWLKNKPPAKEKLTHQIMYVGYLPKTPRVTDVYIQNWKTLVIRWDTKGKNPYFKTTYKAWYSLSNNKWHQCIEDKSLHNDKNCSVQSSIPDFNIYKEDLSVKVIGINPLGNSTSDIVTKKIKEFIVADKVELIDKAVTKSSIHLILKYPKPDLMSAYLDDHTMTYQLLDTTNTEVKVLQKKTKTLRESGIKFDITEGIRPYTTYKLSVRCHSEDSSRWSEGLSINVLTKEAIPVDTPVVTDGVFFIKLKPGAVGHQQYRDITLFWKGVPQLLKNGRITEYKLQIVEGNGIQHNKLISNTNDSVFSYVLKDRPLDEKIKLYITARNSIGYNESLKLKPVIIPKQNEIPNQPKFTYVSVGNGSLVNVTWSKFDGKVTFFWCRGNAIQRRGCSDEISWHKADGIAGNTQLQLSKSWDSVSGRMFGSSVRIGKDSSGIRWIHCLYDIRESPDVPNSEILSVKETEVVLRLNRPECSISNAYINHFIVWYCEKSENSEQCAGEEKWKVVSLDEAERYTLDGLIQETTYMIRFQSVSGLKQSYKSKAIIVKTAAPAFGNNKGFIVWMTILVVVIIVFVVVGFYALIRAVQKFVRSYKKEVPIDTNLGGENDPRNVIRMTNRRGSDNDSGETEITSAALTYSVDPQTQAGSHSYTDTINQSTPRSIEEVQNDHNFFLNNRSTMQDIRHLSTKPDNRVLECSPHISTKLEQRVPLVINPEEFKDCDPIDLSQNETTEMGFSAIGEAEPHTIDIFALDHSHCVDDTSLESNSNDLNLNDATDPLLNNLKTGDQQSNKDTFMIIPPVSDEKTASIMPDDVQDLGASSNSQTVCSSDCSSNRDTCMTIPPVDVDSTSFSGSSDRQCNNDLINRPLSNDGDDDFVLSPLLRNLDSETSGQQFDHLGSDIVETDIDDYSKVAKPTYNRTSSGSDIDDDYSNTDTRTCFQPDDNLPPMTGLANI